MKRLLVLGLSATLVAGALVMPAEAKKKKPKLVATTLYMDGVSNFGEEDAHSNGTYLKLSAAEGSGEKSMGLFNLVASPNTACGGNNLMPVFTGPLTGRIVGDIKVTFTAMSTPANNVEIRLWPDLGAQACNEAYVEPAASLTVPLPAGQGTVDAVLEGADFTAQSLLMLQLTPVLAAPPGYARAFYGTGVSKIEFSCYPPAGKTSCIP